LSYVKFTATILFRKIWKSVHEVLAVVVVSTKIKTKARGKIS
jgi:hypothetical protein